MDENDFRIFEQDESIKILIDNIYEDTIKTFFAFFDIDSYNYIMKFLEPNMDQVQLAKDFLVIRNNNTAKEIISKIYDRAVSKGLCKSGEPLSKDIANNLFAFMYYDYIFEQLAIFILDYIEDEDVKAAAKQNLPRLIEEFNIQRTSEQ